MDVMIGRSWYNIDRFGDGCVMQSCQCFRFYRKTPDFTTQFTIVRF